MFQLIQRANFTTAGIAALLATALMLASFMLFEPKVVFGVDSNSFEITTQIDSELSFLTQPGDVDMTGTPISGLSGGVAVGTSTFNISTNSTTGYTVSIKFATATAMQGDNISTDIANYAPAVGGTPDYSFTYGAGEAYFGYTVNNVTSPTHIDQTFKDNGSNACGGAFSGTAVGKCWYNKADAFTTGEQIINAPVNTAASGATSTLVFQVGVGSDPGLDAGTYTATATLTAIVQ